MTPAPSPGTQRHDGSGRERGALRRPALLLTGVIILLLSVGGLAYWYVDARYHEDTDDAYVGARIVTITAQTAGTVVAVGADETDTVQAAQVLVRLDPADARIELLRCEAELAQAVRQTRALYVNNAVLESGMRLRAIELERATDDLKRRRSVGDSGAVSAEEVQHAQLSIAGAEAALASAREQLQTNLSLTAGTQVASHPAVLSAAARLRAAYLALKRDTIAAPLGGQIARRSVQVGQRVLPGNALMALVPMDDLWVEANFKEVQLANIRVGQPARLLADVYGSRVEYHGRVIGLGAGTGAAFALLPAQNATGNWIKVVQRVPVRIALDAQQVRQHPLRVGLSIRASVDVHDRSGPVVSSHDANAPDNRTDIFDDGEKEADALIARIIVSNNADRRADTLTGAAGSAVDDAAAPTRPAPPHTAATAAARAAARAAAEAAAPTASQPGQRVAAP